MAEYSKTCEYILLTTKPPKSPNLLREGWAPGPKSLNFPSQAIHVWKLILPIQEKVKEFFKKKLNLEELKRADHFHFKKDREQFMAARGLLKYLVACYINRDSCPTLFYNSYGKPYLKGFNLRFNVSHSRDYILIAFSPGIDIGVDVEYYGDPCDIIPLAQEICSNREFNKLLSLSDGEKILAFYRCWTRKEAVVKAIGRGFSFPVKELEVSFLPHEITQILSFPDSDYKRSSWKLTEIQAKEGYVATVAIKEQYNNMFLWDWHNELII